jgi:hypothetical protein
MANADMPNVATADRDMSPESYARFQEIAKSVPQHLYKYRADDRGTDSIFCENTIYFSPPSNFNDPFDCQLVSDTTNSRQEIEDWLKSIKPELKTKSRLLKQEADKFCANPTEMHRFINDSIASVMSETGISCFSKNSNNLLMWSHYANSHRGLCLKFDPIQDSDLFDTPIKVNYSKNYPVYNHLRDGPNYIDLLLSTKSKHWKYEKEWRLFKPDGVGAHRFKKEALIEVVFGCRADTSFINKIRALARGSGMNHLSYKKARISDSEFSLVFEDLA